METGDATRDTGDAGDFLERKSPASPKNLNKCLVGEDIILPLKIPL